MAVTEFDDVAPEDRSELRDALLDQLSYLIDELEATKTVVGRVPEDVQSGRPTPDALSMKEVYGLIATLDADVRRPHARAILSGDTPSLPSVDEHALVDNADWNDLDIHAVFERVQDARRDLVDTLGAADIDAWMQQTRSDDGEALTLFEYVHRIATADLDRLRDLGLRLHNAHLGDREEEIPK